MIELRDLQLLTALARHGHFAKAAQDCGISQPAFSMRIRALEERLGLSIVRRANRFQGLTDEGEMIVRRARQILEESRTLEQEIQAARGEITGTLVLGVIPTAAAPAARLAAALTAAHPRILPRIETMTATSIRQRLEAGTVDAGLTYADAVAGDPVTVSSAYQETYALLVPQDMAPGRDRLSWAEAAELPLCLLEPGMQNRRILDRLFRDLGLKPQVVAESNGLLAAMALVRQGRAATVLPQALIATLGAPQGTRALGLGAPDLTRGIVLVTEARSPERPAIRALRRVVSCLDQ